MLITSYGIDCALSQILYYHHTNKTDFATISDERIKTIEFALNNRPRKRLGWKTPLEVFNKSVALQY